MKKIYVAYHKNPDEIEKSSSGAMFVALSDVVLRNNGKIIGAGYSYVTNKLEHVVCQTPNERDACRGSKYIQSRISKDIYKTIESELNNGTFLLYVGTPCQVAAIKQYVAIKKIIDKSLLTCDIICHGVGSPEIWKRFIDCKKEKIDYLTFKDKHKGWMKPRCIAWAGKKEISLRGYSWLYFSDAIMRPSCYECDYAKADRVGDFTIGDFWKVRTKVPEMFNPRGTSFLMVNTDRAEKIFTTVKNDLVYKEVALDDVIQNNMRHPTKCPVFRNEVMNDFAHKSASFFFEKWKLKLLIGKMKKLVR